MTARALTNTANASREAGHRLALIFVLVLVTTTAGRLVAEPTRFRLVLAFAIALFVGALAVLEPRRLLYAMVPWLAVLALVRRLVTDIAPSPSRDVLVLIGPLAFGLLMLAAVGRGAFRFRSRLSNGVLVLSVLALIGVVNPLQGGLSVGAAGLLFVLVPMLSFWVGRTLDDRRLLTVFTIVAVVAIPAALYGLAQTFVGFPRWDADWITRTGIAAHASVGTVLRPFGSFSSTTEYAMFIGIGLIVWLLFGLRPIALSVGLAAVGLLGAAMFYSGVRGVLVMLAVALALLGAAKARLPFGFSLAAVAALLLLLSYAAGRVLPPTTTAGNVSATLTTHQLVGLAHPLDSKSSTLPVHFHQLVTGLRSILHNPLGYGVGSVSLAATKFGASARATEVDPSNAAVALGLPGLIAYVVVLVSGVGRAYALARHRGDRLGFLALAVLGFTLLQWFDGGLYAVAFLPWLVLGWVDRSTAPASAPQPSLL